MKNISKTLMIIGIVVSFLSCKSSFDATKTMEIQNNRQDVYQEIISNPEQMKEFTQMAQQDDGAKKILMQSHMEMMESGKMMEMMKENPAMKEKMKENMQNMMENNPEMREKMQSKMVEQMMKTPEGRKKLLKKMKENTEMKKDIMEDITKSMQKIEVIEKNKKGNH